MHFKRIKLEKFRSLKGPLIDVRSPSEYYKGHMPNSINIPLFNNEERSIIGTIYKKSGNVKAVNAGLKIVEKKIETLIESLFDFINSYNQNYPNDSKEELSVRVYCSRGGMRSQSISWLLEKYNFNTRTLEGGYKAYRKYALETFNTNWKIIVIGGKTGTGKTKLLNLLEEYNFQIIDLEGLACHRGSTFGGLGMREQPSNEHFENQISEKLSLYDKKEFIFVEAESANIGKCKIPHEFFNQMKSAPRIEILRSEENRIDELISTYSIYSQRELEESVLRIKKRLGSLRTNSAIDAIKEKKWDLVCKSVLEYYDKCYEYDKVGKNIIQSIDLTNLKNDQKIVKLINDILQNLSKTN